MEIRGQDWKVWWSGMKPLNIEFILRESEDGEPFTSEQVISIPHDVKGNSPEALQWIEDHIVPAMILRGDYVDSYRYVSHVNDEEAELDAQ